MTRKIKFGQELDAIPGEASGATQGSQGRKQMEALRYDCQLRNADDAYHQLFLSEIERALTGNARD